MNKQEIFDKVAKHLLNQNKKSMLYRSDGTENYCLYRSPEGLSCAVGCLIPDEYYEPFIENRSVDDNDVIKILIKSNVIKRLDYEYDEIFPLLQTLQTIHDDHDTVEWYELLKDFAKKNKLKFNMTRIGK